MNNSRALMFEMVPYHQTSPVKGSALQAKVVYRVSCYKFTALLSILNICLAVKYSPVSSCSKHDSANPGMGSILFPSFGQKGFFFWLKETATSKLSSAVVSPKPFFFFSFKLCFEQLSHNVLITSTSSYNIVYIVHTHSHTE